MIQHEINRLLHFALQHHLVEPRDISYSTNLLLDVLKLSEYTETIVEETLAVPDEILNKMIDYAVAQQLIEDTITQRDLFDTRIMNCVMPRPSLVEQKFWDLYQLSPKSATDYFYDFSIVTNYIRKTRVDKDQKWKGKSKYGELDITINLSKPEKDPKEIARQKSIPSSSYPKCVLCKENEGFAGNLKLAARQTIRLVSLKMNQEEWFIQYSPYVYYQEHCIILNAQHKPMQINERTFQNLLAFLDVFPHYFIGSNADLPIVGGSILSHDHYQGGCYRFPMEDAKDRKQYTINQFPEVALTHLHWPLTTVRLRCENASQIIDCASHILTTWIAYEDREANIYAYSGKERHNTITPIARKKNGQYELDLVLRNNLTNEEFPMGIFHPHSDVHHIKKENIGLIEVMGLAVLPARLKDELQSIENYLSHKPFTKEDTLRIEKHHDWIVSLQQKIKEQNPKDIMNFLKEEVAIKFERVLEDCAVFRIDTQGNAAFERFMNTL